MKGIFCTMLHCHIPYCRKSGTWPAGEEWLFEAMYETYIPLLSMLRRFQRKNLKPRIMIGIVPVLAEQLSDPYMISRFCEYMEDKIRKAEYDIQKYNAQPQKRKIAEYWHSVFTQIYQNFNEFFYTNIIGSFKWLQDEGVIEILTSAATHGFLPLMEHDSAIFSQIHLGIKSYKKNFNRSPKGFWIPECAYRPREWSDRLQKERRGIDEWLADENIEFFFVEDKGIVTADFIENRHQEKNPSVYRGYSLPSGVSVFGRNPSLSQQVWSAKRGYPGAKEYREFHRKDNDSGLHYWQITGSENKNLYNPKQAQAKVQTDSDHFINLILENIKSEAKNQEQPPLVVVPFDCELFGHWWWEGINWLEDIYLSLFKRSEIDTKSLNEVINEFGNTFSVIKMKPSTWGENSDFTVWNSPKHAWLWPYINASTYDFQCVLETIQKSNRNISTRDHRILSQCGRELLLLEGSDWPFLLYTTQAKEYANKRFHNHHQRFNKLLWAAKNLDDYTRLSNLDLRIIEEIDNPFPNLDWNIFQKC